MSAIWSSMFGASAAPGAPSTPFMQTPPVTPLTSFTDRAVIRGAIDKLLAAYKRVETARTALDAARTKEAGKRLVALVSAPPSVAVVPSATMAAAVAAATSSEKVQDVDTTTALQVLRALNPTAIDASVPMTTATAAATATRTYRPGDQVDAQWRQGSWWTGHILDVAHGDTDTYTVLYDDQGLILGGVPGSEIRPRLPGTLTGRLKYQSAEGNAAWVALALAEAAMRAMKPLADLLVEYAGPQLVEGHHVWIRADPRDQIDEMLSGIMLAFGGGGASRVELVPRSVVRRHRIVQCVGSDQGTALALVREAVPDSIAPPSHPSKVDPTIFRQVQWTATGNDNASRSRAYALPSFADVFSDPTIDDVAVVRAIYAAQHAPLAESAVVNAPIIVL